MSLCINPKCPQPDCSGNSSSSVCQSCNCEILLQGRYRVTRLLSDNTGFGTVYEADDRGTEKILKVLKVNAPKAVELFKQEAQVLSQLDHPGIPKIDSYFTLSPPNSKKRLHCLVMEKIQGENLHAWIHNHPPLSCQQAIAWLKQIIEILDCVHQKQYFHRDIKPANIMLRPNGTLALIDFGTAREMSHTYLAKMGGGSGITSIASAGYTPLEQNNGKAVPQSDFYALGRTFVYLMTGKHPTEFDEDPRTGNLSWQSEVPEPFLPLLDLIDEMMAPFPGTRPQNTEVVRSRLAKIEESYHLYQSDPARFPQWNSPRLSDRYPLDRETTDRALAAAPSEDISKNNSPEPSLPTKPAPKQPKYWFVAGGVAMLVGFGSTLRYLAPIGSSHSANPPAPQVETLPSQLSELALPEASLPSPVAVVPSPKVESEETPPPSYKGEDGKIALEVLGMRQKKSGSTVVLDISLQNNSDRVYKLFSNSWEVTDDREQDVSAVPEDLPEELPANGQAVTGTLEIPAAFLHDSQYIDLKLTDPEDNIEIAISKIPVAEVAAQSKSLPRSASPTPQGISPPAAVESTPPVVSPSSPSKTASPSPALSQPEKSSSAIDEQEDEFRVLSSE